MKIISGCKTEWSHKLSCRHCRAELEITARDIRARRHERRPSIGLHVLCAVCGKEISLHHLSLPREVSQVAMRYVLHPIARQA